MRAGLANHASLIIGAFLSGEEIMLLLVQALDGVLIIGFLLIVTHVFAEQVVKPICEKRKSEDA